MKHRRGRIEVICGSMFSGKSEELIRRVRRALFAQQQIQVFKPHIDDRYGVDKITSHDGRTLHAVPIEKPADILAHLETGTTVVAIDEAQFLDETTSRVVHQLVEEHNIRVIIAGLDMDFRGEPFGPMPMLLAQADQIDKLHAICVVSGEEATHTQRLVNGKPAHYDDPIIMVGAQETYEPRSRQCHEVPGRPW